MLNFRHSPRPTSSIWGTPDNAKEIIPGAWFVTTPSHGGFILSDERQAAMPDALRLETPSYEEDCNYALVVLAFAAEFENAGQPYSRWIEDAYRSAKQWNPQRYEGFTGQKLTGADSHVLANIEAYTARLGKICVVAAYGTWAPWVPEGKTGIIGKTVISVNAAGFASHDAKEYYGLCDANRYGPAGTPQSFEDVGATVIDRPERLHA
jgi:hypothetical protein